MDFSRAELETPSSMQCALCKTPLTESYYAAGTAIVCRPCGTIISAGAPREGRFGRVLRAIGWGTLYGIAGTILYSAIIAFANYQLALLTILIGWLVGVGVKKGSGGSGGLGYQVLAVFLTYALCSLAFVPALVATAGDGPDALPTWLAIIISIPISLFIPFSGELSIIGIAILGIGMWQAFKVAAETPIELTGPYAIAKPDAPTPSASAESVEESAHEAPALAASTSEQPSDSVTSPSPT
jgi:hypothetical protein